MAHNGKGFSQLETEEERIDWYNYWNLAYRNITGGLDRPAGKWAIDNNITSPAEIWVAAYRKRIARPPLVYNEETLQLEEVVAEEG